MTNNYNGSRLSDKEMYVLLGLFLGAILGDLFSYFFNIFTVSVGVLMGGFYGLIIGYVFYKKNETEKTIKVAKE